MTLRSNLARLFVVFAVAGCGDKAPAPSPPAAPKPTVADAEKGAQHAIGLCTNAFNRIVRLTNQVGKEYISAVGGEAPPKPSSMATGWCSSCDTSLGHQEMKTAAGLIAEAKAKPPVGSMANLPAKLESLHTTATVMLAVAADARRYYNAETFKTDKGAGGLEIHHKLLAARKAMRADLQAASKMLDDNDRMLVEAELKQYEATKGARYWFRKCSLATKLALGLVRGNDQAAATAAATELKTCASAYQAFADGQGATLHTAVKGHLLNVQSFSEIVQRTIPHLADPKTPSYTIDADMQNLSGAYNNVVQSSNALYQIENQVGLK